MEYEDFSDPPMEKPRRGRPRKTNRKQIFDELLKFKDRMSPSEDGKLVSKSNDVWKDIAKAINNIKTGQAVYAYVSCNQDDVRNTLWPMSNRNYNSPEESDDDPERSDLVDELLEKSILSCSTEKGEDAMTFVINVPVTEFDKLIETRVTYLRNKQPRHVKRFSKGDWQLFISKKIWGNTRLKCGWNFKYHHLNTDCSSGVIKGHCKCGSELNCIIERNDGVVSISCSTVIANGQQQCGKRYIRGTARAQLGEKLRGKSAHVVRARMANEMMEEDDPEPPHLPTSPTMRTIKSQCRKQDFLHSNPIMALDILGSTTMKDEISWIGYKPFFVHWATKHQRTLYEKMAPEESTILVIDASGSIFSPIIRADGSKSGPLFLYIGVLGTVAKPLTVTQMISEIHTTGAIHFWLEQWIERWGLVPPREVICDCSSALLGALVRAFSKNDTVNEYADEYFTRPNVVPNCYIRIDIAHMMKIFATLLRDVRREVAKFYMVGIGKLTLCRTEGEAKRLVRALLTISRSPNCGDTPYSKMSACEEQKRFLKGLITTNVMEEIGLDDDFDKRIESNDLADPCSQAQPSLWREWGQKIDIAVRENIENAPGTEINAHWLPNFADQLIERLKWLPLWSCITRDSHGYGRCPASSAIVEAEFGIIKNLVLKDADLPMRPDEFMIVHKNYVDGRSKLKEAELEAERQRCARTNGRGCECELNNTQGILDHGNPEGTESCSNFYSDNDGNQVLDISPFETIPAHSSSIEKSTIETECPACENGDMPGGAHRCMICDKAVHVFEPCSLPIEGTEEGYGQKRICLRCAQKSNSQKLLESRAVENWRNQVKLYEKKSSKCALAKLQTKHDMKPKKIKEKKMPAAQSQGKYLQATYTADQFLLTGKLISVPMLKSGSQMKLKPIRKGDKKMDFTNTCAFDSLFHLTLSLSQDSELFFSNSVQSKISLNTFMAMIYEVRKNKITAATYRQRADILSRLFTPAGHPEVGCLVFKCDCTVATLCRQIYKNIPCFEETSTCSADCPPRVNHYPLLSIPLAALTSSRHIDVITDHICVNHVKACPNENCDGVVTTVLKISADHLVLEVFSEDESETIRLEEIPQRLKLLDMEKEFQLGGIINFDSSGIPRALRNADKQSDVVGHYTAFSIRNGRWYQFDRQCKPRPVSHKVSPQLVLYTRKA